MKKLIKKIFCEHEYEYINIDTAYSDSNKSKKDVIMICIKCGKNKKESKNEY